MNIAGVLNTHRTMPERTGNRHGSLAVPYDALRTSDGWVTVPCSTQAHWELLVDIMGDPDAKHARFATMERRCAHGGEVDVIVERGTGMRTKEEVAELLEGTGLPNAP